MTEKKKLIRIKGLDDAVKTPYGITHFHFGFVSGPDTGRVQVTPLATCREYVNRNVMMSLNRSKFDSDELPKTKQIADLSKLRMLIVIDPPKNEFSEFKDRLFNGKAVLNVLEDVAGWEQSKITTVKHDIYENAWLITGPAEWMSQPQLLSIATWVMRLTADYGPIATDDFDTLEAAMYNLYKKEKDSPMTKRGYADAQSYIRDFWNTLYVVLKYHKDIFKNITPKEAWYCKNTSEFSQNSGFSSFTTGKISYSDKVKEAKEIFTSICSKVLPRENKLLKTK